MAELYKWRRDYAPRNKDDEIHPLFVESLMKTDYMEYLADTLAHGTAKEKLDLYENGKADIEKIRKRLEKLANIQRFENKK